VIVEPLGRRDRARRARSAAVRTIIGRYRNARPARRLRGLPSETRDGRKIRLSANVGGLSDVDLVKRYGAEGIGLLRTEVFALGARGLPDEDEQQRAYLRGLARGSEPW
jgi:phosphoenolpyruvate-protein kinase (PTS system EI component)